MLQLLVIVTWDLHYCFSHSYSRKVNVKVDVFQAWSLP